MSIPQYSRLILLRVNNSNFLLFIANRLGERYFNKFGVPKCEHIYSFHSNETTPSELLHNNVVSHVWNKYPSFGTVQRTTMTNMLLRNKFILWDERTSSTVRIGTNGLSAFKEMKCFGLENSFIETAPVLISLVNRRPDKDIDSERNCDSMVYC